MGVKLTDHERMRVIEERIAGLSAEIAQLKATLDYLAILLDADIENEEENHEGI